MDGRLGDFVCKHYKEIILLSCVLTIVSILAITKLEIRTQMLDLLPKNEKVVKAYENARKNFESMDSIIVGVQGEKDDVEKFIENKAKQLEEFQGIKSVDYKVNDVFIRKNALLLMKEKDLKNMKKAFSASSIKEYLEGINDNFEKSYINDGDSRKMEKDSFKLLNTFTYFNNFLYDIKNSQSKASAYDFLTGGKYFISYEEDMGIFIIKSKLDVNDVTGVVKLVNEIEEYLKKDAKEYNIDVSLTGTLVIMRDEMLVTERDMALSSILSLVLIFLIFIIAFRLIRYSILSLIPLIFGVIWSLGITYFIIGHLNIMTSMMGAILIGLGIDYSIHIISIFIDEKNLGLGNIEAVKSSFDKSIKGVITGSITTAAGFFLFSLSSFPGFREFGIVLSTGIISVLFASIFLLPALLIVFGKESKIYKRRTEGFFIKIEKFVTKKNKVFIVLTIILSIFFMLKIKDLEYEKDMMKIEAKGLESISLNNEIIKKYDFSSDSSIIKSDTLNEDYLTYKKADNLLTVGNIDSLSYYLPSEEEQLKRLKVIKEIKEAMNKKVDNEIDLQELKYELNRFKDNLIELADLAYASGDENIRDKIDGILEKGIIEDILENAEKYSKKIERKQNKFIGDLKSFIKNLNTEKIGIDDIPDAIKENYIGKDGTYLTTVYPKESIWIEDFQKMHIEEIKSLGENITGSALVFLKVIEESGKEGKKILAFTVIFIYIILLIDMRNIKYATMALIPMVLSVVFTLGLMALFGIKFNVVNIIGIPLIIGIGIDDGVHIIHRYIKEQSINKALQSTGKAISLTTITTIGAFGTLLLAKYRGFIGFSLVLVIGVGVAYIMTIFFLVSLLAMLKKRKGE